MSITKLLTDLEARLPELEWKINTLGIVLSTNSLPKGLFYLRRASTIEACIAEIKSDMKALALQKNQTGAHFLAKKIQQKINVLVILCQMHSSKQKEDDKTHFDLQQLCTRQQWLQTLEKKICSLEEQEQALNKTLKQMQTTANTQAILNLQTDLGKLKKQLTLAQEAYSKATT